MKKLIFIVSVCCITIGVYAQKRTPPSPGFRMQTPAETAFLNKLHQQLSDALPHTYKNWITGKEDAFDALKHWCSDEGSWGRCLGWIPASVGSSDPYGLAIQVEFNMDPNESGPIMAGAMGIIKDYNNAQQIAEAVKSTNKTKLVILLVMNIDYQGAAAFKLGYCAKTPPQKIALPVPATLAVKGIRSTACPIMESGRASMSANYYDNALVFLGKPVSYKHTETTSDGLTDDEYAIAFDRKRISQLEVQNITVQFKGDSADIDAAIKLIDWQKLSSLIEKP